MRPPTFNNSIDPAGWLTGARRVCSPNFNQRPVGVGPRLLVVHNISLPPGEFGGGHIEAFFCNQLDTTQHTYFCEIADLQVSAHLLITRGGEVTQFVSFLDRAWHAGKSCFAGVENCNDFSIGIELEGTDDCPYTEQQYQVLAETIKLLMVRFPEITEDNLVGHSDIAPQRKTDPGPAFDWGYLRRLLRSG